MEGAGFMRNSTIGHMLSGLPHLKEFYMLGVIRINTFRNWEEQWSDPADLVLSEWACSNLEVFGCEIRGMPRRDTIRRDRDVSTSSDVMTEEELESIDIQRQVCAQLGKLIKLKELTLRVLCPAYQEERILSRLGQISTVRKWRRFLHHRYHDCLAMSLEYGLDLLGNLKELRRVGLEDMDVDIGNPAEQAWVAENWPLATIVHSRHTEAVLENNDDSDQDDESDDDANDDNVSHLHNDKCDLNDEFCNCVVDFLAE
jgi:hypothetical protein